MNIIKIEDSIRFIEIQHFQTCLIDGISLDEISKMYNKKNMELTHRTGGIYKLEKLIFHLQKKHNISLAEYCKKYLQVDWPKCPVTNLELGYKFRNATRLIINEYHESAIRTRNNCPNFNEACKKISKERMGEGNPMFGKPAWNKGLDRTDERVRLMSDKRRGQQWNEESKAKQRQNRKEHPLKARHTTPHSPETVEKMRIITAKRYLDGSFKRESSIHIKMREFLRSLNLTFTEEYQVKYFSIDFAFVEQKIALEVDGDFFHSNPLFYPNGPETKIQERNFGRDKVKDEFLNQNGWTVIRIWECEINSEVLDTFTSFIEKS